MIVTASVPSAVRALAPLFMALSTHTTGTH
jgi:hypothetical protein